MRRSAVLWFLLSLLLILVLGMTGCGGDEEVPAPVPAKIVFIPSTLSMNGGSVLNLSAQVQDKDGQVVTGQNITFSSATTTVATLGNPVCATEGCTLAVCAGKWDSSFVNCQFDPANPQLGTTYGSSEVTATAGSVSAKLTVFVHERVDSIQISAPTAACKSQTEKDTLTARAFTNQRQPDGSIISVEIPAARAGTFSWATANNTVATVASTEAATGEVTAKNPGRTTVWAALSGTNSLPATFETCGVREIRVHVKDSTDTAFAIDRNQSKALAADVTDAAGKAVTGVELVWLANEPAVISIGSAASALGSNPGTAHITAACLPPRCNPGLLPVFSTNTVLATVNGTTTTTAYAASTESKSLVPIDTTTNAAGTAITLTELPNSFVFQPLGTRAFLGSANGLMQFSPDLSTTPVSLISATIKGKVLTVSQGARVVVSDTAASKVYLYNAPRNGLETLDLAGVTAAEFAPDTADTDTESQPFTLYMVAGDTLYVYRRGLPIRTLGLQQAATSVAFMTTGSYAFLAGGASAGVLARPTCDESGSTGNHQGIATSVTPAIVENLPDPGKLVAVGQSSIEPIDVSTTPTQPCPPQLTASAGAPASFGADIDPREVLVTSDSGKVVVLGDGGMRVYTVSSGSVDSIALADGATPLNGGITLDGKMAYVAGSDGKVHRIDLTTNSDAQQIDAGLKKADDTAAPVNLVRVRPK